MKKIFLTAALLTVASSAFAMNGGMNRDGRECFVWCSHDKDGPVLHQSGGTPNAPEIDPASAVSGLALLAGSLTVLLGRKLKTAQT